MASIFDKNDMESQKHKVSEAIKNAFSYCGLKPRRVWKMYFWSLNSF